MPQSDTHKRTDKLSGQYAANSIGETREKRTDTTERMEEQISEFP